MLFDGKSEIKIKFKKYKKIVSYSLIFLLLFVVCQFAGV